VLKKFLSTYRAFFVRIFSDILKFLSNPANPSYFDLGIFSSQYHSIYASSVLYFPCLIGFFRTRNIRSNHTAVRICLREKILGKNIFYSGMAKTSG
jgi:hypothetical protein